MDFVEATVTSKGQITLPKNIRDDLRLEAGSKVLFINSDRGFVLKSKSKNPIGDLLKIRESIPKFSEKEIRKMIREDKSNWSKN
jgi:antitoxin PrlF